MSTRHWSTPATIASGLFVASTGLLMFFGPTEGPFKFTHELAGLLFSVSVVLHVVSNWRPFSNYFSRRGGWTRSMLIVAWTVGIGLVVSSGVWGLGVDPEEDVIATILAAPLSRVAPLVGVDINELVERLEASGLVVQDSDAATIEHVAEWSGAEADDVLAAVFQVD